MRLHLLGKHMTMVMMEGWTRNLITRRWMIMLACVLAKPALEEIP